MGRLEEAATAFLPYPPPGTERFAEGAGIVLSVPSEHPVAIAYHEAATPGGLELAPLGRLIRNENRTKFGRPVPSDGPGFIVMSSRGRRRPATSAVDVASPSGEPVLSPVSGVVAEVSRYLLYGAYRDTRVTLVPLGRPDLRVVIIHLDGVHLRPAERVVAGVTPIGVPRVFPFRSQVNDYIGAGIPHVHIEVKRSGPSGLQAPI